MIVKDFKVGQFFHVDQECLTDPYRVTRLNYNGELDACTVECHKRSGIITGPFRAGKYLVVFPRTYKLAECFE